ncbi:MAG: DUF2156 domain-containing protein [Deltaproteobacteria bacterium]|nr:DUF2156 domain-containing protein [Deltaproteobacteria bacterium]
MAPSFQPLSLASQRLVNDFFQRYPPEISELTFTNLFIWRNYYQFQVTVLEGFLTLLAQLPGSTPFFLPPVGQGDIKAWGATVFQYLRDQGHQPRLSRIPASLVEPLAAFPGVEVLFDRDNSDYLYRTQNLIQLSGNRYHSPKNHVNRFKKNPSWEYQPLTPERIEECLNLQEAWCRLRQCDESPSLQHEEQAILEAFKHIDVLSYRGCVIRLGGKVEAFSLGELLNPDTVVIHLEKANPEIQGLYALINQQFLEKEWSGVPYVNREQDLGEPGLRKAKESYHPETLVEKFILFIPA